MKIISKPVKQRGRPRSFDRDEALEQAMEVFWRYGYESASISDLTAAMGITPPSLYAAFGNKEQLFLEAVERYLAANHERLSSYLDNPGTAREGVARLLREISCMMTDCECPKGCMVVMSALNCSESSAHIQKIMAKHRKASEVRIRNRIERGMREGDVPADTNAAVLAVFFSTVIEGMSIQAKDGASARKIQSAIDTAMQAWPQSK
ncbi:MAG: TetR/AcrR family transcriptional regulator [Verrucomicrobiales bacterium]|jgi:AcrR family transcriptional regulator|nr:TetR/AcrR family transcriptional regulator [Verrucomicrobiales bacterium]